MLQVLLNEAAESIPQAGQDPSESERRHPSMVVKEEEDREVSPLGKEGGREGGLLGLGSPGISFSTGLRGGSSPCKGCFPVL